jgi:hypothetical protein
MFVIIGMGLGLFAAVSIYSYWSWLDEQPWGYLTDLKTGESHKLAGDSVSVGRAQPGFEELIRNQILLEQKYVSRWQLMVSRSLNAFDMRSLNGTVINGRFLPYAAYRHLAGGDLIAVAGGTTFRFSDIEPYYVPLLPRPAPKGAAAADRQWAVLLDGSKRSSMPLLAREYYLGTDESRNFSLSDSRESRSLLKITKVDEDFQFQIEALDTSDTYHLFAMFKYGDRTYLAVGIPSGKSMRDVLQDGSGKPVSGTEYSSKMSFCFGPLAQGESTSLRGMQTQVVAIQSDDEPRCTLGPFQIVDLRE